MACIACDKNKKLIKSHIISQFIRNRLTGYFDGSGSKKYKFIWINRKKSHTQDLPKPNLMCKECDSKLGSVVERFVPELLMPHSVNDIFEWEKLPIKPEAIYELFDEPFWVGIYQYPESKRNLIDRFSLSIAWRALHEMSQSGGEQSKFFLESERGRQFNRLSRNYIFNNEPRGIVPLATLYYLGPKSAKFISGSENEMPFAWAELGTSNEILGIGVIFGYWIILWPLFNPSAETYFDNIIMLERICFISWVGDVKSGLNPNWSA